MAWEKQRLFPTHLTWQWSINFIKMLWCRFEQCLSMFTVLLAEGSVERGLFRHLSDHVFGVTNFWNTKSLKVILFSKYLKFNLDFKNARRNWEKVYFFWDNCIWIGIVKLCLLRTGYFSSAAVPRFGMSKTETFSNSIDLAAINEYDKDIVMQIWTVLVHVYHVACRRVVWKGTV